MASEVAAIMIDDGHELHTANQDIHLKMHNGSLQQYLKFILPMIPFIMYYYF